MAGVASPQQQHIIQKIVSDLRSKSPDTRNRAAKELFSYVSTDLREVSAENLNAVLDLVTKPLLEIAKGDTPAMLGGILSIVALINAMDVIDTGKTDTRISRFGNFLCNVCLASSSDQPVIELAAKALARLTQVSGTYTNNLKNQLMNHEVKRAFEVLQASPLDHSGGGGSHDFHRGDMKRYSAVLVLREIACCMPTFFFQNVSQFFDVIFNAINDPRPSLRESAANAVRAALVVTTQREMTKQTRHQHLTWYKTCFGSMAEGLGEVNNFETYSKVNQHREDVIHGALLVLSELLRCSHAEWERINRELEDVINCGSTSDCEYPTGLSEILGASQVGPNSSPEKMSRMSTVKKYYNAGLKRHARTGGSITQIPFNWFGSVALGKEQIVESAQMRNIITQHYDEICSKVLKIAHNSMCSKNLFIQKALLQVLPKLAAFQRDPFVSKYLMQTMNFTDRLLQGREHKYPAYISVGLLAIATGSEIQTYLKNVLTSIRMALPSKENPNKKRLTNLDPAIFACISMLARAVKDTIKHEMGSMLEAMLNVGLSPALTTALYELAIHIPSFKKDIAEGLLKILSVILMQQQFRHPGAPKQLFLGASTLPIGNIPNSNSNHPDQIQPDTASVVLALRTLGAFNFEGHSLLQFVRHCADNYLHSEDKMVRLEAVKTCLLLLKGTLETLAGRKSQTVVSTVNDVLAKLLVVGITDMDPDVRYSVMDCLDECFDYHLAQAENLSALFVAMNDERFEIRELTMCIIGRLSILNPAYIMPSLRKTLLQLLTELEHSGVGRNKEHSAQLLGHLVANAPTLICPYVEPILNVLIPKLKDSDVNPMVVTSVLRAIGDLAQVGGSLMAQYVDELLPTLLEILGDASSSQKREVSLWTLSQLVASTGTVVTPYTKYPTLLDTLLGFLRTEHKTTIRSQTLRLLGLLGALDPYQHKMILGQIDTASVKSAPLIPISDSSVEFDQSYDMNPSEMLVNFGATGHLDDFYPSVAIAALMKIIRDPTLSRHHTEVVKAVTFIFNSLGIKSVTYISQVIPSMMNVIRSSEDAFRDFLFQQLGCLILIVSQHIRNYLNDIFDLIKSFWSVDSPLQPTIILLVENIAVALGSEFKIYLPQLLPQILRILIHDSSPDRTVTTKLLEAIEKFGTNLNDYMHLILPPIVKLFDSPDIPMPVRRGALECIDKLSDSLDFSEYSSLIIHPLVRCLDSNSTGLRQIAMDTLTSLVIQLGKKYFIFVPMVNKVLIRHKITHQRYEICCARVCQGGSYSDFEDFPKRKRPELHEPPPMLPTAPTTTGKKLILTEDLRRAWAVSGRVSKDDWLEWYNGLCREFLKVSPSPALKACWTVAQRYIQLAKDLFNASFVSCWSELEATQQDDLVSSLAQALTIPDLPEISQTILNLAEFMEHCDRGPLPLSPLVLGEQAVKCRAYAKALHYKEDEFKKEPSVPVVEALMSINNKLGQKEAAHGLLEWGRKNLQGDLKSHERWYEKLHEWEKAYEGYQEKLKVDQQNPDLILSKMRCLEALGEWGEVHKVSLEHWDTVAVETRHKMARMASAAAWGRKDWKAMERFVTLLPRESQDGAFYRAILCVHRENWNQAQSLIDQTRELLDTDVTALSLESYQRAYPTVVCVQMLSELEEVIEYKLVPERQSQIKEMWWKRLQGCQRLIEDWQKILQVRSMVLDPSKEDQRTWLKYAALCRKSGRLSLSHKVLVNILGWDPEKKPEIELPSHQPKATFAYCKHMWMSDKKKEAFCQLQNFVRTSLQPRCALASKEAEMSPVSRREDVETKLKEEIECKQLLARCYLKMGQWHETLHGSSEETIPTILSYYAASTEYDSYWYKSWHAWAVMNFETCLFYRQQQAQGPVGSHGQDVKGSLSPQTISSYAVPALKGFVRSITLSKGSSLQDTLRLLTLLFDYGHQPDMYEALHEGVGMIEVDNWLQVIPQLIARIDTPRGLVGRLIQQLLTDLGKHHPQALVYPLTVACKSSNSNRKNAATKILNKIKEHSETLVIQALMVSDELIRTAILWHEQWHEGLEEASRLYFGDKNVPGMLAKLEPLHAMLEKGPQTLKETSFFQAYSNDLNEAKKWCQRYRTSGNIRDLNQAWDLYYQVFRRISRQLPQLTQLELQYVSPQLLMCRNLELAVPGSYTPHADLIKISMVQPSLQVITSKQRPRKLSILGSNGRTYMFLLKGHEDLRQDERVMQFFSLVNSLLISVPETFRSNLAIQRFAVIPLSTNSGLIGWVPHSDTLHGLIKDYREKKKILLNVEHRLMQKLSQDYDHLPLRNKVEIFEHALEQTSGDDLAKILILKAPSSEVWFDRRTNFTRSLAVMSMVGYVLGLGDRHPSNLLLDRMSGKILHIDFGDCFEVAMTREKFPEKIPFRLTRMLIQAMEVTGIEGTYRCTCESVMTVLRDNKDSLMAVLEAFVYDPLLNWRLIETGPKGKKSKGANQASAVPGGPNPPEVVEGSLPTGTVTDGNPLDGGLTSKKETTEDPVGVEIGGTVATYSDINTGSMAGQQPEALNKKALEIVQRVRDKLTGRDFNPRECLRVPDQVDLLICQATNNDNLCQCYIGWCPFW